MIVFYKKPLGGKADTVISNLLKGAIVVLSIIILLSQFVKKPTIDDYVRKMDTEQANEVNSKKSNINPVDDIPAKTEITKKEVVLTKYTPSDILFLYDRRDLLEGESSASYKVQLKNKKLAIIDNVNDLVYVYDKDKEAIVNMKKEDYIRDKWDIRIEKIISRDLSTDTLQLTTINYKNGRRLFDVSYIPSLSETKKRNRK